MTSALENLNLPLDHPGTPFGQAADTLAQVSSVNPPHLRLNFDLYHAQIGEGNLIELCRRALPWIGEILFADVPGQMEPGTGEINYPVIARALDAIGYQGAIGMEAFASSGPETAFGGFRTAFGFDPTAFWLTGVGLELASLIGLQVPRGCGLWPCRAKSAAPCKTGEMSPQSATFASGVLAQSRLFGEWLDFSALRGKIA